MSGILVFLTATINVGNTPRVNRFAPDQRAADYLAAFKRYIALAPRAGVLFCENSLADLSAFHQEKDRSAHPESIQILSFSGNSEAHEKGKGYGEVEILRHAFDALPHLTDYRYILKISGRYQLRNAVGMIEQLERMNAELVCDVLAKLTYCDTRTFAFKPWVALKYMIPYQQELDDSRGFEIEHLVAHALHRLLADGGSWAPLPCTPHYFAISGTSNARVASNHVYRLKQGIKRKIAKWIYG